ncbi:MBL fold metallo-hydrolase [Epibacterium ulvae]|uniref:MBL fold metallo-hydrolase n=1 Tax=Epibacterium ulvae TaxID=1156985 RepID=UPI001BFC4E2A|nr:MBL fold metallo-hydrolase [Epibacterium ulvae]MBT8155004.1 MBL fold metallo-hydrolase [Epibacterium ulvae]
MSFKLSRRAALGAAAALPLSLAARPLLAKASVTPVNSIIARSFKIGKFVVTTILDGSARREDAFDIFGSTTTEDEFKKVSAENFISADAAQFYFTPTLVDTGAELVLFDTGLGNGGIQAGLAEVGITPEQIDVVVITHMHPDHIGGMATDGHVTFPNARYVTAAKEYDFWSGFDETHRVGGLVKKNVTPVAEKTTFVKDGESVVSGVTAIAAPGHTPGHTIYMLESEGQQLLLTADMANHYIWAFHNPEWAISFDGDKDLAAATRRAKMDMLAADKIPMIGYHMPFPGMGFVETRGSGFRFVPVSYQFAI